MWGVGVGTASSISAATAAAWGAAADVPKKFGKPYGLARESKRGQKNVVSVPSGATISGFRRICGIAKRLPAVSKRIGVGPAEENGSKSGGKRRTRAYQVRRRADRRSPGGIGMAKDRAAAGVELVDRDVTSAKPYVLDELRVGAIELGDHDVERGHRRPGGIEDAEELHRVPTGIGAHAAGQDGRGRVIEHADVEIVGRARTAGTDGGKRRVPLEGDGESSAGGNRDALEHVFARPRVEVMRRTPEEVGRTGGRWEGPIRKGWADAKPALV